MPLHLIDAAKVRQKDAPVKKNTSRWDFAGVFVGVYDNNSYLCTRFSVLSHSLCTMNYKLCTLLTASLLLLAACNSERHERMQQQLAALQAMNQADSILTDDSLAQALADWFDRHGTPNEQMEAHYLLGRTHADRGEAPAAVAAYHDAIDRADTTATDCDYRQLSRVYAQMADIFYKQNLYSNQLENIEKSIYYAMVAGDTLVALNSYAHKMSAYRQLGMTDSVISICRRVYEQYSLMGFKDIGAQYYGFSIKGLVANGNYEEAKKCIDIYEKYSGLFDENHNIVIGREAYYNSKGCYYLGIHQYDSAQYYFRKELKSGNDYNNQNMGAMGLARLFMLIGQPDSATKYAMYGYAMNDSAYNVMSTKSVADIDGMYNYTRHQQIAANEKQRADREEKKSYALIIILFSVILLFTVFLRMWVKNKEREKQKRKDISKQLANAQMDLLKARTAAKDFASESTELKSLIQLKEEETDRLRAEILKIQKKVSNEETEKKLGMSDTFIKLHKKANGCEPLTWQEWQELNIMIINILPQFHEFISAKRFALTEHEYEACVLFRLHVKPMPISVLMGVSPSTVTKLSKTLLKKLFDENGDKDDLMAILGNYC